MHWIKGVIVTFFISLATIVLIDLLGYQFKDKLRVFIHGYGIEIENFSRGYPIGHFQRDEDIGFDITPNFKAKTSIKPFEYGSYDVWGNSYGCFDDEWSDEQLTGGIYLAGDSFTWGYVRYEKKFGTLLEEILKKKVYACGVTHTGQGHQFEKFKRLHTKRLKPKLVIVNIVSNDLDNDFFFPHTDIIDGVMVENIEWCGSVFDSSFEYTKLSHDELKDFVSKKRAEPQSIKTLLKQYSLIANIIAKLSKSLIHTPNRVIENTVKQYEACYQEVYAAGLSNIKEGYSNSNLTKANRNYISKWLNHSMLHDYKILFSFIPSKDPSRDATYKYIENYITENSGTYSRFDDFCDVSCREKKVVYHQFDGHFNEVGNELYSQYLAEVIVAELR